MFTADEKPIVALCTPQGSGSLALIRITGTGAIELVSAMASLSSGKKLSEAPSHTIHHGYVISTKNPSTVIDEVLFLLMRAPKTFTGQDTIEISCHNNPFLINQIIEHTIALGAHPAQRGEFSKRAFLNNKMDLLQAEALNDLITAQTELALKKSMEQLHGTLSSHIKQIEEELVILLSLVTASFEFLEEEQRDLDFDAHIIQKTKDLLASIEEIIRTFNQQQRIKEGLRIALLGNVNVGKSTLFNALVQKERAIVTDIPGTTRDAIETSRYKNGNFWLLIDTAGIRETDQKIEQQGIVRTWHEAEIADIILLIFDASEQLTSEEQILYHEIIEKYQKKIIIVANKIDKVASIQPPFTTNNTLPIGVSAQHKIGIQELEAHIEKKVVSLFETHDTPFLLNKRQHDLLVELHTKLKAIESSFADGIQCELMAYHLSEILETLAQLTGKTISHNVINTIFDTFCIGK